MMDDEFEYDIAFSIRAGKDLKNIRRYLSEKISESTSKKVLNRIFLALETLRKHPERYPLEPLLKDYGNYRVIQKGSYKVFYEFTGQEIIVVRIINARRNLGRILGKFKP